MRDGAAPPYAGVSRIRFSGSGLLPPLKRGSALPGDGPLIGEMDGPKKGFRHDPHHMPPNRDRARAKGPDRQKGEETDRGKARSEGYAVLLAAGGARPDRPVQAAGEEAAAGDRRPVEIDDVEHLTRRARKGDRVGVGRHDIGHLLSIDGRDDALIEIGRAVRAVTRVRDLPGGGDQRRGGHPLAVERRADEAGMIGLRRVDAGCRFDERLVRQQGDAAHIGGDANILEQIGAEQEELVRRIGIEGRVRTDHTRRTRRRREGAIGIARQVDRRLRHRRTAQRIAQEGDVRDLVIGDFARILRDDRVTELDWRG